MNDVVKFETIEFHGKELKALSYNGVPYVAIYQDKGYTQSYTGESEAGHIYNQTRWTEKGREFLHRLHQKKGIPDD